MQKSRKECVFSSAMMMKVRRRFARLIDKQKQSSLNQYSTAFHSNEKNRRIKAKKNKISG